MGYRGAGQGPMTGMSGRKTCCNHLSRPRLLRTARKQGLCLPSRLHPRVLNSVCQEVSAHKSAFNECIKSYLFLPFKCTELFSFGARRKNILTNLGSVPIRQRPVTDAAATHQLFSLCSERRLHFC